MKQDRQNRHRQKKRVRTGYTLNGVPFACLGNGPGILVIFDGLDFMHRPPEGMLIWTIDRNFRALAKSHTVYLMERKPNLPPGYSVQEMAADNAKWVQTEIGKPVHVMGVSTGGPIAQFFAVDYPELTRSLTLVSSGYCLSKHGLVLQDDLARLAQSGRWRSVYARMIHGMVSGLAQGLLPPLFWLFGIHYFGFPESAEDALTEIAAEARHNFQARLGEIRVPTLVIGGEKDDLYPIPETAAGIQGAHLVLYPRTGHSVIMKRRFSQDVANFLAQTDNKGIR